VFGVTAEPAVRGLYLGDVGRVRQIVCNLISNAVKFTTEGSVEVKLKRTVDGVTCAVRDTGPGILADRVERLFKKFVQADSSTTREFGGTGLGLAICQELAGAMGGAVTVVSRAGEGSTFTLALPLQPAPAVAVEDIPINGPAPACEGAMRILAAEDNPVNQMVLRTLLAQVGLTPLIVGNGAEAVAAWEQGPWDLILMDIQMPVMDGPSAARQIRRREAQLGRAPTPILALTANALAHQAESYRADGMDGVVAKPIDVAQLLTAIAEATAGEAVAA
jgi:CheY-like chemotaxis protein